MEKSIRTIEGNFVNFDGFFYGRVELDKRTGRIKKITEPLGEADLLIEHAFIFPGFGDVHVHAREDISGTQTYKEDFQTMSKAAAHGGVTFVADMPNNPVPPVDDASYKAKQALAELAPVKTVLYAGIGPSTKPLSMRVPYKVFMGPSVGDLFFESFEQLENVIKKYSGCDISFHCENPEMISGRDRPAEAETSAIEFALYLIKKYELQGKICHCSTSEGVSLVSQAKQKGTAVTCEVTPHHLYFDNTSLQVNPPLRAQKDRLALIEALREGIIDYLATDHAPHTKEEKEQGISGMPHLDTYGAFATWLRREHGFTPQDIARVCSYNPGQFVNQFLPEQYGKVEKGYVGSFTIIDPDSRTVVQRKDLQTKCGWSPFEGVEFPGSVQYTIHKGTVMYEASH